MPRLARIVLPGLPHHVTHRGNRRAAVFFTRRDRNVYLRYLAHYSSKYQLAIWAYCLMTNHVHLLVVPSNENSMARTIGRTHMMYSRDVNSRNRWSGHLWANRYYSAPVEPEGSRVVARYIELNPVRAQIASRPEEYRWSSAGAHCLGKSDPLLDPARELAGDSATWRLWLREGLDEDQAAEIRRHTATGTPLGSAAFIARIEKALGRRLVRRRYVKADSEPP